MAHFTVVLTAPLSAPDAWERVLDLRAHGEVIPFTSLRLLPDREHHPDDREHHPDNRKHTVSDDGGREGGGERLPMSAHDLRPGSRFVARTAWGPFGFDDAMVIETMRAPTLTTPGFARIRKEGNVIRGWIDLTISGQNMREGQGHARAHGPGQGQARITWSQVIRVRWVPRLLDPLVAACARGAYGTALRRLLDRH